MSAPTMPRIRLVTFDILHTLITPRKPIPVQYAEVFKPYLGPLEPDAVKASFKTALKVVRDDLPVYHHGAPNWWSEVIKRTALGAGADPDRVHSTLEEIVPALLKRFSSGEGYMAFKDAIPTVARLHEEGVHVGVVSNGDSRFRLVLKDLGFPDFMEPMALSEEVGVEKPDRAMFEWTIDQYNSLHPIEMLVSANCLHIGDELQCDYHGAVGAGFQSRLLRRPGLEGEQEHKEDDENLEGVRVIGSLEEVLNICDTQNKMLR